MSMNMTAEKNAPAFDTSVTIAGVTLKNPVMTASGTFGSGAEYSEFVDLNKLGAVVTKGVANVPWPGNPTPRIAETYGGMINAIGLQNPGLDTFVKRDIPFLKQYDTRIIVNVCGNTVDEYVEMCRILNKADIDGVELNLSCPNVKKGCLAFGTTYDGIKHVTSRVRKALDKPLIVKLTPNVPDITITAKAAEDAGADGISLINTLLGMKIDIDKRRPVLANNTGGLSGPAIKPVAVRMVYQVSQAVNIPILGLGGIVTSEDVVEFMLAGATAVSIGTGNFISPEVSIEAVKGLENYLKKYKFDDVTQIIGKVQMN